MQPTKMNTENFFEENMFNVDIFVEMLSSLVNQLVLIFTSTTFILKFRCEIKFGEQVSSLKVALT